MTERHVPAPVGPSSCPSCPHGVIPAFLPVLDIPDRKERLIGDYARIIARNDGK